MNHVLVGEPGSPGRLSQPDLVCAIIAHIGFQGVDLNRRQLDRVFEAATSIVKEVATPHREATPCMGLKAWFDCDDTGRSSVAMAWHLAVLAGLKLPERSIGLGIDWRQDHPHDPADFGRCVGLLEAAPELRPHLHLMASASPVWAGLVARWGELEALYREERPSGVAPKLYAAMRSIIESAGEATP